LCYSGFLQGNAHQDEQGYSDQGLVCDDAEQPAWHRSEKSSFKTSGGDTDGSGDQRSAGEG